MSQVAAHAARAVQGFEAFAAALTAQVADLNAAVSLLGHGRGDFGELAARLADAEACYAQLTRAVEREETAVAKLEGVAKAAQQQVELAAQLREAAVELGMTDGDEASQAQELEPAGTRARRDAGHPPLARQVSAGAVDRMKERRAPTSLRRTSSAGPRTRRSKGAAGGQPPSPARATRRRPRTGGPQAPASSRQAVQRPSTAGESSTRSAGNTRRRSLSSGRPSPRPVPCIVLPTADELMTVPKYQRGRLTHAKLQAAVEAVNALLAAKYRLMRQPVRKLWGADLAKYQAYKKQETKEVKGSAFFCLSDIKSLPPFKGSTGTSVLQVLRHLKTIKAISGGGEKRFVVASH